MVQGHNSSFLENRTSHGKISQVVTCRRRIADRVFDTGNHPGRQRSKSLLWLGNAVHRQLIFDFDHS